jgi:type I restriction enzyme, S subunit
VSVLGDVLEPAGIPERVADPARERFVTVRLNCGGAIERSIGAGKTPVPFTGYRVRPGQFIYSRIDARNGAFALIPPELDGAVVSKDFPVFDVRSDRINDRYLTHFFASGRLERAIRARSRGATNRQRIKEDEFLAFPIELPSLPEQRRIAAILDHADALRAKRRHILAHLDTLTQAIFHDMFARRADAVRRLDSLVDAEDRMNYGVVQPGDDAPGGVPLIRVSNLVGGVVHRSDLKHISPEIEAAYGRSRIKGNEILVSCVGSIGSVSLVRQEDVGSNIARAITRVPISDPVTRTYVAAYLRTEGPQRYFVSELRTVAQPTLNVGQLAATEVPIPPPDLQRKFAVRLAQVNNQRSAAERMFAATDELSASLQSRAFRGEL